MEMVASASGGDDDVDGLSGGRRDGGRDNGGCEVERCGGLGGGSPEKSAGKVFRRRRLLEAARGMEKGERDKKN
ncbi:hypothetical protein Tco_0192204 [Tanacetum coccineum]